MKTKISIFVALIIASFQLASAGIIIPGDSIGGGIVVGPVDDVTKVYIHEQQALQIAKEWYGNRTDVDYYIGASELIDNDYESNASELPDSSAWVRTGHHWLIVVDEHPNQNWSHECGYVYVQCERSRLTATRSCRVPGRMLPNGVNLRLTNSRNLYGNNASLKPTVAQSVPNYNTEVAGKTFALIINSASSRHDNLERYWNDCSFIYKVLTNKYNVMTDNIRILMPTDSLMRKADGSGYTSLPRNIGTDIWNLNINTLYDCLDEIKIEMNGTGHLLVFITGNAGTDDSGEPYILLQGGNRMTAGELERMISSANVRVTDYVLGVSNASAFSEYLSGKGHVITAATGADEAATSCVDKPFSEFLMHWTAAMCGSDALGNSVASDSDGNERMTLEEAFAYADSLTTSTSGDISTVNRYLKEDVAFNNIPEGVDLYIRDNIDDTGKEPNNTTDIEWNSPDIWITNLRDPNKQYSNQMITIDLNNSFNHIYANVRVTNRGQDKYNGVGKYLHLYWTNMVFNIDLYTWLGVNSTHHKDAIGQELVPIDITDEIEPGQSKVFIFEISIPKKFLDQLKKSPNTFGINVLARISDNDQMGDNQGNPFPVICETLVAISESNDIAQKSQIHLWGFTKQDLDIILGDDSVLSEYSIESDDPLLFNKMEMSIEMSPTVYQLWKNSGEVAHDVSVSSSNPRKFFFHSPQSFLRNVKAAVLIDSLKFSYNILSNEDITLPQTYSLYIKRKNLATNKIISGTTVTIFNEGRNQELTPSVASTLENGIYTLAETNVSESATYQWIGNDRNIIAEGKSVNIDATEASSITRLRVEASDGAVKYVDVKLDNQPIIESISPNPFTTQISVKLSRQARTNTKVFVNSISTANVSGEFSIPDGESDITIYISDYPAGIYSVSVMENGKILGSKQVIKQ